MKNERLLWMSIVAIALLLAPAIAMRFTREVVWTAGDFIVAGALLFGTVLAVERVLRKVPGRTARIAACAIVVLVLLVVWAELAVGLFGSSFAGS